MKIFISTLKKNDKFSFNNKSFTVKQKFSDWKKNGEPYLLTICGEIFYFEYLEVELINK